MFFPRKKRMKKKARVKVAPKKANVKKHNVEDARKRILEREKAEEELVKQELRSDETQGFYHVKHHIERGHLGKSVTHEPAQAPSEKEKKLVDKISKLDEETKADILMIKRAKVAPEIEAKRLMQVKRALEFEERKIESMRSGKVKGKKRTRLTKKQAVWLKRRDQYLKTQIAKLNGWISRLEPKKTRAKKGVGKPVVKKSATKPQKGKTGTFQKSSPRKLRKAA